MSEINVTGIIGGTIAIGRYVVNDYVITITETEGDYGYTMTITKGTQTQTVTLYGLTSEQYDAMLRYLEQAQAAAQSAAASSGTALDAATRAETAAGQITGMTAEAETLAPGSQATASFLDGVLSLGIPAGEIGATGAQGDPGPAGETGNGIVSIIKTGTQGNVDTYTITYTNGTTSTFTVTNGTDGAVLSVAGKTGAVTLDAGDVEYDDTDTYAAGTVGAGLADLKSQLDVCEEELNVSVIKWEKGGLNMSNSAAPIASSYNAAYRARTPADSPFRLGGGSTISPLSGFYIQVEVYDSDGYSFVTWITSGSYTVQKDSLVWVLIRSSAVETGDAIPLETLTSGVSIVNISSVDKLSIEVAKSATDIATLQNAITETNNVSLVNNSDSVGTGVSANTRRWILPYTIPQNSYISTLLYHTASATSGDVIVEIWKNDDNTLILDKSVRSTPSASSVNTVDINYQAETSVMIGWKMDGGTSLRHDGGAEFVIWAFDDLSSNALLINNKTIFDSFKPCVTVNYTNTLLKNFAELPETVLTVGEGMKYEQIQDAINAITDDSAEKPYTLLVMPQGTPYEPFSMLRVSFDDAYPWSDVGPRYISIIGLDKAHCVIRSDSGNYKLPCGEPMMNGIIKNLTFIMTNDNQDPTATQGGYCLHVDCRTRNDVGYDMIIEDCNFENASGPCLGIGMHKNCALTVRRCNFKTTLSTSYLPHEGYTNLSDYGVIFCHSSTRADATDQHINIEDCFGVCAEGTKSLWLATAGEYDPSTASFYYRLLRNVFWNETQNAPAYSISNTLTAEPMNFGNNMP